MGEAVNIWNPQTHPKQHAVTELLLTAETVSADELKEYAGGSLSPRTLGAVFRAIEDQEATILRRRVDEWGTLYRYAPDVEYTEQFRLSSTEGGDGQRWYNPPEPEPPPMVYRRGDGPMFRRDDVGVDDSCDLEVE